MSFATGVSLRHLSGTSGKNLPNESQDRNQRASQKGGPSTPGSQTSAESSKGDDSKPPSGRPKASKKHQKSLSSRLLGANKRVRADSAPTSLAAEKASLAERPESASLAELKRRKDSLCELEDTSFTGSDPARPKHIPIIIPEYANLTPSESRSGSITTLTSTSSGSSNAVSFRSRPRHVEIKIPSYAQPLLKQPQTPPRISLNHSIFGDPFADITAISPPDMSHPTPDLSRTNTMDSSSSAVSPIRATSQSANGVRAAYLASANSSQTSLLSQREEYESASEAESNTEDEAGSNTPNQGNSSNQSAGPRPAPNTPGTNPSQLSGLVCNVHRTTGREPHPLVGATTTILGDKLYVFGGRRLSRSKPQLTSNLYELDLIRRHWTKLECKGDIPPPRYFHSVCSLGDCKLVCYGGMSPAPAVPEGTAEVQPEVIVMSDIHIYDVPTKTWSKLNTPDAPQGRYAHCAAILPSAAVFASAHAPMSAVHHNPQGNNPNQGSLGVALDGTGGAEMVVVGGQDSANHYIEQISIFNLRSLKWTGTTGMGRSCGAYRSVVTPLTSMSASQIGAGPHNRTDLEDDEDESTLVGSGAPMLIYSNYNFLDVKLELQVRLTDGSLTEKPMQAAVSPPGLRFPNGGVISNHFVVSGTFLTSSKQEYALWALDLKTLNWSRIDAGGSIFNQGSWNRGVLWNRRNSFVILGNRKRSLVDDYNNRRINFTNVCVVELEAFGLYDNPRKVEPTSNFASVSSPPPQPSKEFSGGGRPLLSAGEDLGSMSIHIRELADMEFLAIDGTRLPVNSRLIARRWGAHFISLLREALVASETDSVTLRPTIAGHPSRNSSITITPSVTSAATTLTANTAAELPDSRSAPPQGRPRLFYLPHTVPTLQALLHYLYTSTLPSQPSALATPQILCSLLQLARPYKIDGLLEAVVDSLHESLDGRNAAAIFNAAAMGAGGGDGVHFASAAPGVRDSAIPLRTASLAGMDSLMVNGTNHRATALRIDTEMANGRNTRNTLRPGQNLADDSEDEVPNSAATDASMSDFENFNGTTSRGRDARDREVWNGTLSAVIGLQKRGLRGLMEGRRMRERGKTEGSEGRVGLGIA